MQLSIIGVIVCASVLLSGYLLRAPLIGGLVASLAFGSTALMTLSSLGGSSPLIYTFFAAQLIVITCLRRRLLQDLGYVFGRVRPTWILLSLMIYALVGAWLFPRLFAGQTSVFVVAKMRMGIIEDSLAPVTGNTTQTGYFILGGLAAIAVSVLVLSEDRIAQIRRGFFLWCCLHAGMGALDLIGKMVGEGDVLLPIRTASYSMLTDIGQGGFWRVAGSYSEASAFGAASLASLSFCFVYWRKTGSTSALFLSLMLFLLTVLSTSSTAYVGLVILSIPVACSVGASVASGRVGTSEVIIVLVLSFSVLSALVATLYNEHVFDLFADLFRDMIFNKASSGSGQERTYWNIKSLQAFVDTGGVGIGLGSSRASSWLIAVISQLGLIGSIMMAALIAVVARGLGSLKPYVDHETDAVVSSVQACVLASMLAASISGGTADPGTIFFIGFAVIIASRARARQARGQAGADLAS
jgi:hypothetical protein